MVHGSAEHFANIVREAFNADAYELVIVEDYAAPQRALSPLFSVLLDADAVLA